MPTAEFCLHLLAQRHIKNLSIGRSMRRFVPRRPACLDPQRATEKIGGQAPVLLDRLEDARAKQFEQSRHDDHQGRADFLDIRGEFLEAFGVINLSAKRDREVLAARMLISVACRKKGQEYFVTPAEIRRDDVDAAFDIVQDRAVMLPHPARRAARAAGVDQAGKQFAPDLGDRRPDRADI